MSGSRPNGDLPGGPGIDAAELERFAVQVVRRATQGRGTSLDAMLPLVYDEMRVLASCILRGEGSGRTLRPTALANETYLRLARETRFNPGGRGQLLAAAATIMRRVLIDYARARRAAKRGGSVERVTLSESLMGDAGDRIDLLDLHRALDRLAKEHPRKVRVVELLYFAGLTHEEAGEAMGVTARTVLRDWQFAKAWLWRELNEEGGIAPPSSLDC
jgi:RNA polymerase sigma factor (TIGR02999 family)